MLQFLELFNRSSYITFRSSLPPGFSRRNLLLVENIFDKQDRDIQSFDTIKPFGNQQPELANSRFMHLF